MSDAPSPEPAKKRTLRRQFANLLALALVVYLLMAYFVLPMFWDRFAKRHPALEDLPGITHTKSGIPGDPINVALIGTKKQLIQIMLAAKWYPADPLSLKSCLEISEATILKRPYNDAPVSNLFLYGRKEDLAFEQPVGDDPRQRNHVRFWESEKKDDEGRPMWVGSATYDKDVGLSHTTGEVTHHIDGDLDKERDHLFENLQATGDLAETEIEDDFQTAREGRNGGGDPWHTDGKLYVGVIRNTD